MHLTDIIKHFKGLELSKFNGTHISSGTILDAKKFVETSIEFLKANKGNETFKPYYDRLFEFYQKLNNDGKANT